MFASSLFAANTLHVSNVTDDGAGNVSFTLGYNFDVEVAGFQFDLLSDGAFMLADATGGACTDSGFMVSTNASGRVIGFSLTGATISPGMGDFITLTGTYDRGL